MSERIERLYESMPGRNLDFDYDPRLKRATEQWAFCAAVAGEMEELERRIAKIKGFLDNKFDVIWGED